jgi:hypothetical protein
MMTTAAPARVQAAERTRDAVQLRIEGATFKAIGQALGCTKEGARRAVLRGLDEYRTDTEASVAQLRLIQNEQLQSLLANLWPAVQQGDVRAIATAVRVLGRQARLNGLDAPTKVAVSGGADDLSSISDLELEERCRRYGVVVDALPPAALLPDCTTH